MSKKKTKMKFGIQPTGWTNDDFQEIGNLGENGRDVGVMDGHEGDGY